MSGKQATAVQEKVAVYGTFQLPKAVQDRYGLTQMVISELNFKPRDADHMPVANVELQRAVDDPITGGLTVVVALKELTVMERHNSRDIKRNGGRFWLSYNGRIFDTKDKNGNERKGKSPGYFLEQPLQDYLVNQAEERFGSGQ